MDTLETIFSHNLWANLRLFGACSRLTDEQLDASIAGVFGSLTGFIYTRPLFNARLHFHITPTMFGYFVQYHYIWSNGIVLKFLKIGPVSRIC